MKGALVDKDLYSSLMTEIHSYVQPERKNSIYGCGAQVAEVALKSNPNDIYEAFTGAMFKMNAESGDIDYMYTWGIPEVLSSSASYSDGLYSIDKCKVIAYDEENSEIVMMMESTHASLRPDLQVLYSDSDKQTDLVIVTMREHGDLEQAWNINYYQSKIFMTLGSHSGFAHKNSFFFGAQSDGFRTKL